MEQQSKLQGLLEKKSQQEDAGENPRGRKKGRFSPEKAAGETVQARKETLLDIGKIDNGCKVESAVKSWG